jgi:hypothetical protein
MPGDEDCRRVGSEVAYPRKQVQTVHPRHLDVGDDRVVVPRRDTLQRGRRRLARVDRDPFHAQAEGLRKGFQ